MLQQLQGMIVGRIVKRDEKGRIQSRPAEERFWSNVSKTEECWNYTGGKTRYGKINVGGKSVSSHRFSYELHFGTVPEGLFVCHKCDNKKCVNPEHLFAGTAKENTQDFLSKGLCNLPKGERHHNSKLSEKDVLEILQSSGSNESVAKKYGVSRRLIGRIKSRELWRHL